VPQQQSPTKCKLSHGPPFNRVDFAFQIH